MNLESFERKATIVERIKSINSQLDFLVDMGDKMCQKAHCQAEFHIRLTDTKKKQQVEAEQETNPMRLYDFSFLQDLDDRIKEYSDRSEIHLNDNAAIRLVGFLIKELTTERDALLTQLSED